MSATLRVAAAGMRSRRLQTVLISLTTLLAVTASTLGVGLAAASESPFDHAFARHRGAELSTVWSSRDVGVDQLVETGRLPGVTATAGPFPVVSVQPVPLDTDGTWPAGVPLPGLTVVAREGPESAVDELTLVSGRWPTGPDEIVVRAHNEPFIRGNTLRFAGTASSGTFRVVGTARSISETADAWVLPTAMPGLTPPGTRPNLQMLYRFTTAQTTGQMNDDRAAIAAAAPAGALIGASSYLKIRSAVTRSAATFAPFVISFGLLALVLSSVIISVIASGLVTVGRQRIAILKSLGATPRQVTAIYLAQTLLPGLLGTAAGCIGAVALSVPILGDTAALYGVDNAGIPAAAIAAVAGGAVAAMVIGTAIPARRAATLSTSDVVSVGRGDERRGVDLYRLLERLPLPVALGAAIPLTRVARTLAVAMSVGVAALGATFGTGLVISLDRIQAGIDQRSPGDVVINGFDQQPETTRIGAILDHQAGTAEWFASAETTLDVEGLAGPTTVISYEGDSSWAPWQIITGRWFERPGEVDVPSGFLAATGTKVGDTVTLNDGSRTVRVAIVGEVLAVRHEGMLVVTQRDTLSRLQPVFDVDTVTFQVRLRPRTDPGTYVEHLNPQLRPLGISSRPNTNRPSATVLAVDGLATGFGLLLLAVAVLGILSTVMIDTRERVRDLGIYKAVGMSPAQVITMIITSVGGISLVATALAIPAGIWLHAQILPAMARAAGTALPPGGHHVFGPTVIAALFLGSLLVTVLGALPPSRWAARLPAAAALHAE